MRKASAGDAALKEVLTGVSQAIAEKHISDDAIRMHIATAYELGERMLVSLRAVVLENAAPESLQWLWGEKESALSVWMKLSATLIKLAEWQQKLAQGQDNVAEQMPVSAQDQEIIAHYFAHYHHEAQDPLP